MKHMDIFTNAGVLLVSLMALGKSAELAIDRLIKLSQILKWDRFVVAFVILGMATSMTELFVGVNAAFEGKPELSLGNILGATMVLLGLVLGIVAYINGQVRFSSWIRGVKIFYVAAIIALPIFLLFDFVLSRLDAAIIIAAYGIFTYHLYKSSQAAHHADEEPNIIARDLRESKLERHVGFFLLGFIGIFISSRFAVSSAITITTLLNIPVIFMGVLVFAVGTNLPELILTITALKKRQRTIVMGNVLGSALTNSLVLAVVSLITPIRLTDLETFGTAMIFFLAILFLFSYFSKTKNQISREEGIVLLILYAVFVLTEIVTKVY